MTRQELAVKAREAANELVAAGWDYDDARFVTMTLATGGILDEQLTGVSTPAIEELKAEWKIADKAISEKDLRNVRVNSDNEFEDQ